MKNHIRYSLVLVFLLTIFSIQPLTRAMDNSGQEPSESNPSTEVESTNQKKIEEQKALAKEKYEQARQKAQESLEKKKEQAKEKTAEQRQKACQNLSTVLNEKLSSRQNKAVSFKTKLDGHLTKITTFVESNNIELSNYQELLSAAQKASQESQAQIDNLMQYQSKIDCSNTEKAPQSLSTFKEALSNTRDSLKEYRESIKNLLNAVKEQAQSQGLIS